MFKSVDNNDKYNPYPLPPTTCLPSEMCVCVCIALSFLTFLSSNLNRFDMSKLLTKCMHLNIASEF